MHHKIGRVLLTAVTLFIAATAFGQVKNVDQIVAWVNNDVILKSEYELRIAQIRAELADPQRGKGLTGAQLDQAFQQESKRVLQQLIDEALFVQQARDMGLSPEIELTKTMDRVRQEQKLDSMEALEKAIVAQGFSIDEYKQNIRTQILTSQVMQREVYPKVILTNEEGRKYYDAHIKDFDRPACVRLREITVITENRGPEEAANQRKKIDEALAELKKGEDFVKVVEKYSESSTAQEGGDLGFTPKDQLNSGLGEIIAKLDKGQVSDVIPVQGAFMIFKLDDKHEGGVLPYELAQKEIFDILWQQAVPGKTREYLAKLRADGFVRVADGYVDAGAPEKTAKADTK